MPHQCVRCGLMYQDGASPILTGCTCGSKLFYYIKQQVLDSREKLASDLPQLSLDSSARKRIEKDIYDIIGDEIDKNMPVVLDVESVRVTDEGRFELDLVNLFNNKQPLVYKLEEGKYVIDLPASLNRTRPSKK
jgi:uncharacterized protein